MAKDRVGEVSGLKAKLRKKDRLIKELRAKLRDIEFRYKTLVKAVTGVRNG